MIELSYKEDLRSVREIELPISKSVMNRELILCAKSGTAFPAQSPHFPDDVNILINALGSHEEIIDLGAAGTAMRFCTTHFACGDQTKVLTGSERMKERPIADLVNALRVLGADIDYLEDDGYPPIRINPVPSMGGEAYISGAISSQYISSLLLSAHRMKAGLSLELLPPVNSRPYIDLTLSVLKRWGIQYTEKDNHIKIPHQDPVHSKELPGERDWSAAAFLYGLVALDSPGELKLKELRMDSMQGDRYVAELFEQLGVTTEPLLDGVLIKRSGKTVERFNADLRHHPDLAQAIAFTCAGLGIHCELAGLQSLKVKETDRILAIVECLQSVGLEVRYDNGGLSFGGRLDIGLQPLFESYDDHRMAMSLSILGSRFSSISILNQDVVNKSFPDYWKQLKSIGYTIRTAT